VNPSACVFALAGFCASAGTSLTGALADYTRNLPDRSANRRAPTLQREPVISHRRRRSS